jgi:hypothetical protein
MRKLALALLVVGTLAVPTGAAGSPAASIPSFVIRSLDGSGNNLRHPDWGMANRPYLRVASPNYADGASQPVSGPPTRYVSNRIFNDESQNIFSENGVTQWGFVWGQFLDHTFGLRQETGGEDAPIAFDATDPLEDFRNTLGAIPFSRTPAAPGTGTRQAPRQEINTVSSYIDAFAIYGGSTDRLEWLRDGPVDGNMSNNSASLLLPNGYLPRRDSRGDPSSAPVMALDGRLLGTPDRAAVSGDQRVNENIALTATHTLFAREHNRIVAALPKGLPEELKFQIARRVVGAEQQYITYNEFLPALGLRLSRYRGYEPGVNATLSNEFAVVGYRAHSMIHGELESEADAADYTPAQLDAIRAQGVEVTIDGDDVEFVVPLNVAFFNPDLVEEIGAGPILAGIGSEPEYRNDEQIDNQLRSVLFQVPVSGNPGCLDGPTLPECFSGVVDLAAIDIERGRDHGMPYYNDLRKAYGLPPERSFTDITGESTDRFPDDPLVSKTDPIDDPDILDFVKLIDRNGAELPVGSEEGAVVGIRRTSVAARLKAIYGDVGKLDAFVGMSAEKHVPGTEFGELEAAIWRKQFEALRDGDRFFYLNDPALPAIQKAFGITYRHTLSEIIAMDTGETVAPNVFEISG